MSFPSSHSIPTLLAPSPPLWVLYCSKKRTSKSLHFGWSPTSTGFAYIVSSLKLNYSLYLRVTFHSIDHMSISIMYLDFGRKRRLEPKILFFCVALVPSGSLQNFLVICLYTCTLVVCWSLIIIILLFSCFRIQAWWCRFGRVWNARVFTITHITPICISVKLIRIRWGR